MVRRFRIVALSLLVTLGTSGIARSEKAPPPYVPVWPESRQHLLAGHYIGQVRDPSRIHQSCEFLDADLDLRFARVGKDVKRTYTIVVTCPSDTSIHITLRSVWWITVLGDACLLLQAEPTPDDPWGDSVYGFRIDDDANALYPDGGGCVSADERDNVALKRVPFPFDPTTSNR